MLTLTKHSRSRRHGIRLIGLMTTLVLGPLGLVALRGGDVVAASNVSAIDPPTLKALPLCAGAPSRSETVSRGEHEVTGTTLAEASSVIRFPYDLPGTVPDWVSCQLVEHLGWSDNEPQSGGITLWLYAHAYPRAPAMELFVAPPPLEPRPLDAPLDGWDFAPISGRPGWFQFLLPPGGPESWTEIAWFADDQTYYRLRGSFPLDVALEIADSVAPNGSIPGT
jgi:hypothetical protein